MSLVTYNPAATNGKENAVGITLITYSTECANLGVKFIKSLVVLSLVGILLGS